MLCTFLCTKKIDEDIERYIDVNPQQMSAAVELL